MRMLVIAQGCKVLDVQKKEFEDANKNKIPFYVCAVKQGETITTDLSIHKDVFPEIKSMSTYDFQIQITEDTRNSKISKFRIVGIEKGNVAK